MANYATVNGERITLSEVRVPPALRQAIPDHLRYIEGRPNGKRRTLKGQKLSESVLDGLNLTRAILPGCKFVRARAN